MTKIHMLLPLAKWAEHPRLKPKGTLPEEMAVKEADLRKFWSRVKVRNPDECWEWTGGSTPKGYGKFRVLSLMMMASHFSLYSVGREIPKGMEVCHKCDNPRCVNPDHLFTGTRSQNMRDCVSKGRLIQSENFRGKRYPRAYGSGELCHNHKLKDSEVISILESSEGTRVLSARYSVSYATIQKIKRGERKLTGASIK